MKSQELTLILQQDVIHITRYYLYKHDKLFSRGASFKITLRYFD